jgi:hypothetical protein
VKEVIEAFAWMKLMMNNSFPHRLRKHCLFPTMSSRRCLSIVARGIQETPEHCPDASRLTDLIWLSMCECCAKEITSGYCTMARRFFKTLPEVSQTPHYQDESKRWRSFIQAPIFPRGPEPDSSLDRPYNAGVKIILFDKTIR